MKIKVFASLILTFIMIFNVSVSSFAAYQEEAVNDSCPFIRMGLNVFPGDDIPAITPHGYSEPVFIGESESGGRIYCGINTHVINGASINLLPEHQTINMTEEDLDILVDFVVYTLLIRNIAVGFNGYFEDALREAGLYETFFSRIGERMRSQITPVPHWSTHVSTSLQNGQEDMSVMVHGTLRITYDFTFNPFATVDLGFRTISPMGTIGSFNRMSTSTGTSARGSFTIPPATMNARLTIRHSPNSNAFGIALTGTWSVDFF